MKKLLLSVLSFAAFTSLNAQNCSELFFSEYVEGTNNNKALEIYNPTPNPITINQDYRIVRYNNGTDATTAESNTQAYVVLNHHVIQPYDVWVLVIDKRDPNGTGNEIPVDGALQAVADTFVCPDYNVCYALYHNGNDALSIQKLVGGNWTYVDIFGEIGVDPINSWSDCPPMYDGSCGAYWTKDQTLIRKPTVEQGVTVNPSPFIAPAEYDSLPVNTFDHLGYHVCDCQVTGIKQAMRYSEVKLFPNPGNGTNVTFYAADKRIAAVVIYNAMGQKVKVITIENPAIKVNLDLNLSKGMYFSEIVFDDKSLTSEKLIIE